MDQEKIKIIADRVIQSLQEGRKKREQEIPKVRLEQKHVRNCDPLLNREKLLEKMPKKSVMAEIGVDQGEFSQSILNIVQPEKMHLIDSWGSSRYHDGKFEKVKQTFSDQIDKQKVQIHRNLSTEAVNDFEDQYFDWIYIDTDHSYETTRDEIRLYASKVKEGGIIAGHDYVKGNWITTYRYGVIEAAHEFCVENNWELIYLTVDPIENQSFAIRKID